MAECKKVAPLPINASCGLPNRHPRITIEGRSIYRNDKYFAFILAHNEKEKKLTIRIRHSPALRKKIERDHTVTTMYYK